MNNCAYTPPNWLFIDFLKANDVKAGRVELVKAAAAGLTERGVLAGRAKPSSDRQSTTLTQKQQPVRA